MRGTVGASREAEIGSSAEVILQDAIGKATWSWDDAIDSGSPGMVIEFQGGKVGKVSEKRNRCSLYWLRWTQSSQLNLSQPS